MKHLCKINCKSSKMSSLCCLTCNAINELADTLSIAKSSCQLILEEFSMDEWKENKVGILVKDNLQLSIRAIDRGKEKLSHLYAVWILTRDGGFIREFGNKSLGMEVRD